MDKKPRKLSLHKMIPNMITLTAMASGMTAIRFAIDGKWQEAVIAVFAAAFMDAFDGAAARLLKAQSKLGAELDSLSDFVGFGVAPAIITFLWTTHLAGRFGWITALVFMMGVALRLARFNVAKAEETPNDPLAKYFTGVPSPLGAGLALLPLMVAFQIGGGHIAGLSGGVPAGKFLPVVTNPYAVGAWLVVVAAMMVSHIPTFSSKQIRVPQKMSVPALAVIGLLISGLINETWPTLTLMIVVYLLAMPLSVRHYARKKLSLEQGISDPDDLDVDE
ncbi:MAG: CDP-alcohol phosphatidyltransferase family protein [Alphaproteobacteria bacterium]|nr:CDP-alcohol phosphatidyltransferase family protein [Alphaproteobacteria bacterium]MDE2336400.1 CDP-alcohol phosphatidyltransferase family protein [Alphaproteobacteria bacterium]